MKRITLALLGATLLSPAALAQSTTTPSATDTSPPAASSTTASSTASTASAGQFMQQAPSGQWRASKLVGVDIYGQNNEKVGDVKEILVDQSGNAKVVVIGVGGFLGLGEKNVGVAFSEVKWSDQPAPRATSSNTSGSGSSGGGTTGMSGNTAGTANTGAASSTGTGGAAGSSTASSTRSGPMDYPDHGTVSWSKDQLKNAPDFKYASDASRDNNRASTPATGGATSGSGSTNR